MVGVEQALGATRGPKHLQILAEDNEVGTVFSPVRELRARGAN